MEDNRDLREELDKSQSKEIELKILMKQSQEQIRTLTRDSEDTKRRLNAELQIAHKQVYEKIHEQEILELKVQLERFASNETEINTMLTETTKKLRKSSEELKYTTSRLAEADKHAQERSDVLSQQIRDLKKRFAKSESSERALSIHLQQSRADLKFTNEILECTQASPRNRSIKLHGNWRTHKED
ncbi:hypothetical protein DPMN_166358 [Dreissena polymorpha]|uniref:Uncharacterized protein n=1 Tax=Dreissena polymorpha TaxID=45954 RepID=A0A9D4IXT7_DREPO|nr:hypothetical protein DPMN_166358 [Dreissena polymorpha]